jgi:SpoVK/Ycf46/Vps4 family AAA+-type ATPase
MAVSDTHRFLHGVTPSTAEKRIWVLSGQTQDVFFHNLLRGCLDVRRTLELWALEHSMALVIWLDRYGALDFSGNPDPMRAQEQFEAARARRAPRYGHTRASDRPDATTPGSQPPSSDQQDDTEARARQTADQARQAAGGDAQSLQNTFSRLTQLLKHGEVPSLVLVEDFPVFIRNLRINQQTLALAETLLTTVQKDWHGHISAASMLVFLTDTPQGYTFMAHELFPPEQFRKVHYREIDGPKEGEIQSAIERLAPRHGFCLAGAEDIARNLTRHGNLVVALGSIKRVVNEGREKVTLESVLQLPPLNEGAITSVKRELDALIGLQDVKVKVSQLESKARLFRRKLADGASDLPEETLHLVFTGNPGTGKTTVAKIVARFFHAIGLLRRDEVKEVTASGVMSAYVGETRENMQRAIEEALGGVLFIDEAHQFGDPNSTQAREAIQALVPMAWNHRHELVIILAGYENRMHDFFAMDEGLPRRFPPHGRIHFPDYSMDELWNILERKLHKQGYAIDREACDRLRAALARRARRRGFGNAGGVDNMVAELLQNHAVSQDPVSMVITRDDLPPLVRRDPTVYDLARASLDSLVGLEPVRQRIQALLDSLEYDLAEEEHGRGAGEVNLRPSNMLFVGPPGTGKTTVGRLMADLLYGIGCIERQVCVVVSRGDLIGEFQGHSAPKVRAVIDRARDGVLFIDEAYAITLDSRDTFGNEAVSELVAQITNPENEGTVFILAGYEDAIREFLTRNAGLSRRFPEVIRFPNFGPADCMVLVRRRLETERFSWQEGLIEEVGPLAEAEAQRMGAHFGNAGWVHGLVDAALQRLKTRVIRNRLHVTDPDRCRLLLIEDLPGARARQTATVPMIESTWTPRPEAICVPKPKPQIGASSPPETGHSCRPPRRKRSGADNGAIRPPEEIGRSIAECSSQIIVEQPDGQSGVASGFFVTSDGLLVTSAHVIENARTVKVLCGPKHEACPARVLKADTDLDLALLVVEVAFPCMYLLLGDSRPVDPLRELIVYGNAHVQPGEPGRLVMARVVRNDLSDPCHLETDGAIEPGFSGGPAYDPVQEAVVGVVRGGYGPSATLFVRVEQVREMLGQLGYRFE